jgi:ribosomal protein S21
VAALEAAERNGKITAHRRRREDHLSFVTLREGEDGEGMLKRFQTLMQRSGILRELRNRRFFRTKGEQGRLDKARSLRRLRRRQLKRR